MKLLSFLLVLIFAVNSCRAACNGTIISKKCYIFNVTRVTFDKNEQWCKSLKNGSMVSIHTLSDNMAIAKLVKGEEVAWLGGKWSGTSFTWSDRSKYIDALFNKTWTNRTIKAGGGAIYKNGSWINRDVSLTASQLCRTNYGPALQASAMSLIFIVLLSVFQM